MTSGRHIGRGIIFASAFAMVGVAHAQAVEPDAQAPTTPDTLAPGARVDLQSAAQSLPPDFSGSPGADGYLEADTQWWTFGGGASMDFDELSDVNATFAWTTFLEEGVEFTLELAVREFDQPGNDAWGLNPAMVFRWHWWESPDRAWTSYVDIGIGVMLSDDDVPFDGTSFNFTPRGGVGITRALTEEWRLQAGLRWSHISNARIFGSDDNPSSDGIMLYLGLITRFR